MKEKTPSVKKKAAAPAAKAKSAPEPKAATAAKSAKSAKPAKGAKSAKGGWAETMKKALEAKRPAGGFPDQPKPRDSGVQKVKKNAF